MVRARPAVDDSLPAAGAPEIAARGHGPAQTSRWWELALLGVALLLPALVYFPITGSYFVWDDFLNLYQINDLPLVEYLVQVHGGHLLVVRNAIFFLCHALFDLRPGPYYWLVLLTHLANVFLLFRIVHLLTGSAALACFGAVLSGTSPANVESLDWYSVYGHVLVGTIVFAILLRVLRHAEAHRAPSSLEWGSWYAGLLVACCAFGVGIGIALVFPLVVLLLLQPPARSRRMLAGLATLVVVVPGIYALVNHLYVTVAHGSPTVTAELVGMLKYPRPIVEALAGLLTFGVASLLGSFCFGRNPPTPGSYALVALFALALGIAAVASPQVARRRLLAVVVVTFGAYGIIAAGRGPLAAQVASLFPLGVVAARYQYVGQSVLAVILCLVLARLAALSRFAALGGAAGLVAWLAVGAICYARGGFQIDPHRTARAEMERTVTAIRNAIAGGPPGGDVYIQNQPFHSIGFAGIQRDGFPGWAAVFVIAFPENVVDGRRVHFIERDRALVATVTGHRERRTASLLVPQGPS